MYEAKEHEKLFGVRPIGVKYICPFCNEGEMKVDPDSTHMSHMYPHKCTKCNKKMQLNKVYPYVEFDEITDEETRNDLVDAIREIMTNVHVMMKENESK